MRAQIIIILFILFPGICSSQGEVIAHRGASSIAPENTISAFNKAIELGSDYIELDIRMSKDDSLMVIHDETIDRTTNGTGYVDQFNYEELKGFFAGYADKFNSDFEFEKIPSLFEVLELAKGKLGICVDIKNTPEAQVIDLIIKMQMLKDIYLMSYNVEKLKNINTIDPQIQTILIKNTLTHVDLDIAKEIGCSGVSTSYLSSELLTSKAHDKGLIYWAGIVNDPAKAERLFNNKVDAIITNYPQLMTMNTDDEIFTYPNPFRESINIHFNQVDDIEHIFIIGVNGSIIYEFFAPYSSPIIWEPQIKLTRGLYLIFMIKNEKTIFEKILFID